MDDAIASRCVARLTYPVPEPAEQARIWQILSRGTGAKLSDRVIAEIVELYPRLTGRDVKNLLKLAMLMRPEGNIDLAAVRFVKQFQPTGRTEAP